jgi:hypothetical protein
MKHLSEADIRQRWQEATKDAAESKYNLRLQALSRAIGALQGAGIDVDLELFGQSSEMAFLMRVKNAKSWWQKESGILRVGNAQHLFTIIVHTQKEEEPKREAFLVKISSHDIRFEGARDNMRHDTYDLMHDPEALVKLQESILSVAKNQKAIAQNDVANAFNRGALLPMAHPLPKSIPLVRQP